MALLELQDIGIGYRHGSRCHVLIDGIRATATAGRFICLIGRNGCGKSTLLRTLAGLQPPLSGEVFIDGRPLATLSRQEIARLIGVVLTTRPALRHTSVRDLVRYGRLPYSGIFGSTSRSDDAAADTALEQVGISHLASRHIHTLSDGEQQKALIAKALAQGTDLLLLDEPTAFLDYPSKLELMTLLRRLAHDDQKTILLSTHDIEMASRFADSLWHIKEGEFSEILPSQMETELL